MSSIVPISLSGISPFHPYDEEHSRLDGTGILQMQKCCPERRRRDTSRYDGCESTLRHAQVACQEHVAGRWLKAPYPIRSTGTGPDLLSTQSVTIQRHYKLDTKLSKLLSVNIIFSEKSTYSRSIFRDQSRFRRSSHLYASSPLTGLHLSNLRHRPDTCNRPYVKPYIYDISP